MSNAVLIDLTLSYPNNFKKVRYNTHLDLRFLLIGLRAWLPRDRINKEFLHWNKIDLSVYGQKHKAYRVYLNGGNINKLSISKCHIDAICPLSTIIHKPYSVILITCGYKVNHNEWHGRSGTIIFDANYKASHFC